MRDFVVRLGCEYQEIRVCSHWFVVQAIGLKLGVSLLSFVDWMKKDAASTKAGEGSVIDYAAENAGLRAEILNFVG